MRIVLLVLALVLVGAHAAAAHEAKLGDLRIVHPWARASPGAAPNGAAYLTIENGGDRDDRLISASTPVADRVEVHTHIVEDGVAKMRPVEAVDVPAKGMAEMKPGGLHVMLISLHQPLKKGETFALTLTFEHAGSVEVEVIVEGVGATGPSE